jgi:hypothetical protein
MVGSGTGRSHAIAEPAQVRIGHDRIKHVDCGRWADISAIVGRRR